MEDLAPGLARRETSGMPVGLRLAITLALPLVAAISVTGIFLNKEVLVAAAWFAFAIAGTVFIQPLVGVAAMTATFMVVAYPTMLQTLGVLTLNNLLGVCLGAVLAAHVLTSRDLSVLKLRPVLLLGAIGILLLLSTAHAEAIFPVLRQSQSLGVKGLVLDRTSDMMHDYWVRLVFLIFFCSFVREGRDLRVMFFTFVLVLFLAVPSALINWMHGTLSHGFRTMASVTAGANANRLAMIGLIEMACWWAWAMGRPGMLRRSVAMIAIGGSLLVVLASGSRSGLLGCGFLAMLLQSGPRRFRVSAFQIGLVALAGAIAIATIVPSRAWDRMLTFSKEDRHAGATASLEQREQTIDTALLMVRDYPLLGIGIGNFREVARQVYLDPFFRPPHNSYLWAASEGGLFVLAGYLFLFWISWRDLSVVIRLAARDPATEYVVISLRVMFYLYSFFAFFADLWLNPITYFMIGMITCLRRHLERLPPVAVSPVRPIRVRARAA
jgi:O-antigen ligase